jgi:hypothetical protein
MVCGCLASACSAEVIPASGRIFVYPSVRHAPSASSFPAFTAARIEVEGVSSIDSPAPLNDIEWSIEGGRYGDVVERVVTVSLLEGDTVKALRKVRFILPWSGAKRLDLAVESPCATASANGSEACDAAEFSAEWIDITTLPDANR